MLKDIGKRAKKASADFMTLSTNDKNKILQIIADNLLKETSDIIAANSLDIIHGKEIGLNEGLIDRLLLTEERVKGMAEGIQKVIFLEDPIGEIIEMKTMPNGLRIGKKRVPMGVVGIIYEARPNVTVDTAALCLKSSNVLILRGGKEAINSNIKLVEIIRKSIADSGFNPDFVQLIEDSSYEVATQFMRLNGYVDVLIPRGSNKLIQSVVQNATVPVLETGVGNCHVFVDESADLYMAMAIIENAKTQRIGVCNAMESLLLHKNIAKDIVPAIHNLMEKYNLTIRADERSRALDPSFEKATEEDWGKEYLDYIFSQKIVDSLDEAIAHINRYGTGHSEVIVTSSYENAFRFTDEVDAAAVYVNASSRFTDGFEFGMGAEMGISTQKLHARGPVGLKELTTTKYIIFGNGQIRK